MAWDKMLWEDKLLFCHVFERGRFSMRMSHGRSAHAVHERGGSLVWRGEN